MKNKFFKKLEDFFALEKSHSKGRGQIEVEFRQNVEKVMREERDFTPLYDYEVVAKLNEEQRKEYLKEVIKKYFEVKKDLEGSVKIDKLA